MILPIFRHLFYMNIIRYGLRSAVIGAFQDSEGIRCGGQANQDPYA